MLINAIKKKWYFFLFSSLIIISDQVTKQLIVANLRLHESINVLPFFNIVYVENTGTAFGMFQSLGNSFFVIFSVLAILFIVFLILKSEHDLLSFSMFLGGAIGNLYDRIYRGYVVDFIDVYVGKHHWPAFNIADSALTIGIVLLILGTFIKKKPSFE